MTDKKFTDEEIIKALMCHFNEELDEEAFQCVDCPLYNDTSPSCTEALKSYVLDLINRQKSEIERLKECPKCVYEYDGEITEYCVQGPCQNFKTVEQIKAEAYKEFVEKLKKELLAYRKKRRNALDNESVFVVDKVRQMIDNLLKEMVGEK